MKKNDRIRGILMMTVGVLLILGALVLTGHNLWTDYQAGKAAEAALEQLESTMPEDKDADVKEEYIDPDMPMPTKKIDGKRYIGKISVPSVELKLPVLANWNFDDLMIAPCVYSGSYYSNDLVIAGHNYSQHYRALLSVETGAKVTLKAVDGKKYTYVVSRLETLRPNERKHLTASTDKWDLTLFTCTIGGRTRHAVRCIRTDDD